jgi:acyl-CoA thioesterase FadM
MNQFINRTEFPKKLSSSVKIRFQDCDLLKYFDYFFNAREDHVAEEYELDYSQLFEQEQTCWVVYNHQIAYLNSAKVSEKVNIVSSIVYASVDTTITEYVMLNADNTKVKAMLWTTSKYIDVNTGLVCAHQDWLQGFLDKVSLHLTEPELNFNLRLKQIKKQLTEGTYL